jgi:PQQ-dependent catabolism-associated CXXCW motif protein
MRGAGWDWRALRGAAHAFVLALAMITICHIAPALGADGSFAEEDRSWGVEPPAEYRSKDYHAPTPDTVPGAKVVRTLELKAMLELKPRPFLVDVLSGPAHPTLPGSLWLHNGGLGDFDAAEEQRFINVLALLSGNDKAREIVFFCSGPRCWLSYNAALRAVRAGYTNLDHGQFPVVMH